MKPAFRTIVITGASKGVGAALAAAYAAPEVRLLLIARDVLRAEAVARTCQDRGATVEVALIDVRDAERLAATICAFDAVRPVDLIVANAGIEASLGPDRTAETLAASVEQIRVNFEGVVATVTPLLDRMRQRRQGAIVLVSSLAALEPLADQPIYSGTKAAVAAWGQALRAWLRPSGVTVTVAYPGFVPTGMKEAYRGPRPYEVSAAWAARRIAAGVARGRPAVMFPWQLVWLIRLGHLVPGPIRDAVIDRWFAFDIAQ